MKTLFKYLFYGLIGIAIGIAISLAVIKQSRSFGIVNDGYWSTNKFTSSTSASPYTRSIIAIVGILALNKSETVYYGRNVDDDGNRLNEKCTYEISGVSLPARWWSVTLYAPDNYLPINSDNALSIDATKIVKDGKSDWKAIISARNDGYKNWLSSKNARDFDLTLRLYNPEKAVIENLALPILPHVKKLGCKGGSK